MIEVKLRRGGAVTALDVSEDGEPLLVQVAAALEEIEEQVELLQGFPPRAITERRATARALGVKNGELLIVRLRDEASGIRQGVPKKRRRAGASGGGGGGGEAGEGGAAGAAAAGARSRDELAEKLIAAFQPGASGGSNESVGSFLRRAARQAVATQYEISAGSARLAAALSGDYIVKSAAGAHCKPVVGGFRVVVSSAAGPRGRRTEDEVTLLTSEALRATLTYVLAVPDAQLADVQELVRPAMMAQVSPSTFWSLTDFARGGTAVATLASAAAASAPSPSSAAAAAAGAGIAGGGGRLGDGKSKGGGDQVPAPPPTFDLDLALQHLAPSLDWGFLAARRRAKSEKAEAAERAADVAAAQRQRNKEHREAASKRRKAAAAGEDSSADEAGASEADAEADALVKLLGSPLAAELSSKYGASSVIRAACLETAELQAAQVSLGESKGGDERLMALRADAATQLFGQLIGDPSLVARLAEESIAALPFDLVRLRVPGRVEFCAKMLMLEPSVVRGWQIAATALNDKHAWLKDHRKFG
jgi:hypothetical protein